MILVDTSIWVDHFRARDAILSRLLARKEVIQHPFVIGEIMMGNPRNRAGILTVMSLLPQSVVAQAHEVLGFVERNRLHGRGIGYIDAHLLASARLTRGTSVWTRDRRMFAAASELGLAADGLPTAQ
jgi:predicted nucleic acid-binding protein